MLKTCLILGSFGVLLVAGLPAPQDEYADEYADEEVCLTSKDSKDPEKECIFPFTFNNFTYSGCPIDPRDETKTKRWCSTKVDETGNHIAGGDNWGYCTLGCNPYVFKDEFVIGSDAGEASSRNCDWTACNGFTLKLDLFEKEITMGQCQYPTGKDGSKDDYFCYVNADSNCKDKTLSDEENNRFVSSVACKDPRAPVPRFFGLITAGIIVAVSGAFTAAAPHLPVYCRPECDKRKREVSRSYVQRPPYIQLGTQRGQKVNRK